MKKRYVLTLTQENMEGLQNLLREMGFKPESGVISDMVDEFIGDQLKYGLPAVQSGRKPTTLDYFRTMIEKIDDIAKDDSKISMLKDGVAKLRHDVKKAKESSNIKIK